MEPMVVTLLLLVLAIVLFALERLPVDIVGILLVIALVATGVLTIQEGVAGFGNDIIITIAGLFILVGGLIKTGIVDLIGRRLHKIAGDSEFLLTALIMLTAAIAASVLKNTTTTAMFLPVVIAIAAKAKIPPSKLLMPLAFGANTPGIEDAGAAYVYTRSGTVWIRFSPQILQFNASVSNLDLIGLE